MTTGIIQSYCVDYPEGMSEEVEGLDCAPRLYVALEAMYQRLVTCIVEGLLISGMVHHSILTEVIDNETDDYLHDPVLTHYLQDKLHASDRHLTRMIEENSLSGFWSNRWEFLMGVTVETRPNYIWVEVILGRHGYD